MADNWVSAYASYYHCIFVCVSVCVGKRLRIVFTSPLLCVCVSSSSHIQQKTNVMSPCVVSSCTWRQQPTLWRCVSLMSTRLQALAWDANKNNSNGQQHRQMYTIFGVAHLKTYVRLSELLLLYFASLSKSFYLFYFTLTFWFHSFEFAAFFPHSADSVFFLFAAPILSLLCSKFSRKKHRERDLRQ